MIMVRKERGRSYLETLEVAGRTQFSKRSVKRILRYIYENYDLLMDRWEALHGKKKEA